MGSAGPVDLELPALLALAWRVITEEVHAGLAVAGYPDIRTTDGYTFQLLASTGGGVNTEWVKPGMFIMKMPNSATPRSTSSAAMRSAAGSGASLVGADSASAFTGRR